MDVRVSEQDKFVQQPTSDTTPSSETRTKPRGFFSRASQSFTRLLREASDRNLVRPVLMYVLPALVVLVASYMWITGGRYVSTDDAYVRSAKLMVSAQVSGAVSEVDVHEGQYVHKGDVLFRLDRRPFEIALDNSRATLANSALVIDAMKQDYKRMQGDIDSQRARVALAKASLDRVQPLLARKFVSPAAFDQARFSLQAEQQKLQSLEDQAKSQLAKLGGNPEVDAHSHPQYLQAKAQADEAQRQLDQTVVRAPFDGYATQVSALQPGVFVVTAMSGFSSTASVGLVSTQNVWVEANIKETDLTWVKAGDKVTIDVDTYPSRHWHGSVESIGAATGAEFSLLPTTNSGGNWTKVVQRVPVRIRLEQDKDGPVLRSGMSTTVSIDTGHVNTLF
jgi:membrane fusion protein (multidrug efflux system)